MSEPKSIYRLSRELEMLLVGTDEPSSQIDDVPWFCLPPGYSFKVIFPYAGAYARFFVAKDIDPSRLVSVCLETQNISGPYWDIQSVMVYLDSRLATPKDL